MRTLPALTLLILALAACMPPPGPYYRPYGYNQPPQYGQPYPPPPGRPQMVAATDLFFNNLRALCGQTFRGRLVSTDSVDAEFARKPVRTGRVECMRDEVRIPVAVGEDASRTWIVRRKANAIQLKHLHRKPDGKEDSISWYGGDATKGGSPTRQEFPADSFSKRMFTEQKRPDAINNVWAMEVVPGELMAYELSRKGRFFRLEFDLARPLREGS